MSIHRTAAKRDDAEPTIIAILKRAGASVQQLSGKGIPDLLVGWRGQTILMEVKAPPAPVKHPRRKPPATGQNEDQLDWASRWRGSAVHVVTSPQDALALLLQPTRPVGRLLPEIEP